MEPGKTARSPDGSTDAEPDGILIRTVGGESSVSRTNDCQTHDPDLHVRCKSAQIYFIPEMV
jgi:hypothetical protein